MVGLERSFLFSAMSRPTLGPAEHPLLIHAGGYFHAEVATS